MAVTAQHLDVQDLTNNNGYIPIKTGELKLIGHYDKVLHFINLTAYEETVTLLSDNLSALKTITFEDKQLLNTLNKNFILLKAKIDNLHIHSKSKRGLINVLGKGLKYIAGSMDSDDELEIRDAINRINDNEQTINSTVGKLTHINNFMTEQIGNITKHINKQQSIISRYINVFKSETQNRIKTLEDEVQFIEQTYSLNNDIVLLTNHINDIGQIIFSCKLGVIPTDILTQKELNLISDFDSYTNTKVAVLFQHNNIILTLFIPQFSSNTLTRIKFESLPDILNKSVILNTSEILADSSDKVYDINVKDNLEKNLIALDNKCIENILRFKEAQCNLEISEKSEVVEMVQGIIIFKNFKGNITHDCSKLKVMQKGTFLIKFENCKINVLNKTYTNVNLKMYETLVLPNLITKIKENKNVTEFDLKIETLQMKYEDNIRILVDKNKEMHVFSLSSDISIIISIITLTIIFACIIKSRQISYIVSEPTEYVQNTKSGPFLQITTTQ